MYAYIDSFRNFGKTNTDNQSIKIKRPYPQRVTAFSSLPEAPGERKRDEKTGTAMRSRFGKSRPRPRMYRPPAVRCGNGPARGARRQILMSRISKWIVPAGTSTSTRSPFLWPSSAFAIGVPMASLPSRRLASCSATIV